MCRWSGASAAIHATLQMRLNSNTAARTLNNFDSAINAPGYPRHTRCMRAAALPMHGRYLPEDRAKTVTAQQHQHQVTTWQMVEHRKHLTGLLDQFQMHIYNCYTASQVRGCTVLCPQVHQANNSMPPLIRSTVLSYNRTIHHTVRGLCGHRKL